MISIFEDNFESGILGYTIVGAGWSTPGGALDGTICASVNNNTSYNQRYLKKTLDMTGVTHWEIDFKLTGTYYNYGNGNGWTVFAFLAQPDAVIDPPLAGSTWGGSYDSKSLMISINKNEGSPNSNIFGLGFSYSTVTVSSDQWYRITIDKIDSTLHIRVYNSSLILISEQYSTITINLVDPNTIYLLSKNRDTTSTAYFDNVKISKLAPNIVATNITLNPASCAEPCTSNADITWTNNGDAVGSFEPAIKVDGIRTGFGVLESLAPMASIIKTFILSNMMVGSHSACPDPNPTNLPCATLNVGRAVAIDMILSSNTCTGPCIITATVTWQNPGSSSITFRPAILVDSSVYAYADTDITIPAGATGTASINTPLLSVGDHTICPYPD